MPRWMPAAAWALASMVAQPARAQFGDLLNKVQDKATDAAAKAAEDALTPKPAPAPSQAPAPASPAAGAEAKPAQGGSGAGPPPGEVYGNRYDFVPGDKVLVYDDFADTDVGEYPAKWTVKAVAGLNAGGGNPVEVVEVGGKRFLKSRYQNGQDQGWSLQFLRYAVKGDMPKNFTIEFDADMGGSYGVIFTNPKFWGGQEVTISGGPDGTAESPQARGRLSAASGVCRVAIAVSGTQVKLYVCGERVLVDPDGVDRPIQRIGILFPEPRADAADHQMIAAYRLAEGGKPAKQMLAGEGRIVTHGILFDTGSDVIRPESGPSLRSILALLQEDPALRFLIEGHTDDQGGPSANGPLSERRALAVKVWLVKQGVDERRLKTKGLGATKPVDSNDTAEGRANNRRVEFVKTSS